MQTEKKKSYYILKLAIALALMLLFQFIPAPAPMTQTGMAVLGLFFGLVVLIATVDVTWPVFVVLCIITFLEPAIYGEAAANAPLTDAVTRSFGNWVLLFMVGTFLLSDAMNEWGLIRRITLWFVTRKIAKKGPWPLTIMFLLACWVLSLIMDSTACVIVMIMCAHEIFNTLGFKKGDAWPCMVVAAIPFVVTAGYPATPISHPTILSVMSIVEGASGMQVQLVPYMINAIPISILFFVVLMCYLRFVVKPNLEHFKDVDYEALEGMKCGPLSLQEKIVAVVNAIVIILWVLPGVVQIIAPGSEFATFLNKLTMLYPTILGVTVLALIRIDGKPLLNVKEALSRIAWPAVFMMAAVFFVSNATQQANCGIIDWVTQNVAPLVSGFSPFLFVTLSAMLVVVATNILNNTAMGVLFASALTPIAMTLGINPTIMAAAIGIGCYMAFTTPAASVAVGFSCTDPYCSPGYVLKHGIACTIIAVICVIAIYPLGQLVF